MIPQGQYQVPKVFLNFAQQTTARLHEIFNDSNKEITYSCHLNQFNDYSNVPTSLYLKLGK